MSRDIDPNRLDPDEHQYVIDRPFLAREFVLQGFEDPLAQDEDGNYTYPYLVDKDGNWINGTPAEGGDEGDIGTEDGGETNVQSHLPEDQRWEDEMKKAELQAVIDARNADRSEEDKINPSSDKNEDMKAALSEDDAAIAAWLAENPDEGTGDDEV